MAKLGIISSGKLSDSFLSQFAQAFKKWAEDPERVKKTTEVLGNVVEAAAGEKGLQDLQAYNAYKEREKELIQSQDIPEQFKLAMAQYVQQATTPQPLTKPSEFALKQIEQQMRRRFAERGVFRSTASEQAELGAQAQYLADLRKQRMREQAEQMEAALGSLKQAQALWQTYRQNLIQNLKTMLAGDEEFLKAKEQLARSLMQIYNIDMQTALDEAERRMMEKMAEKSFWSSLGKIFGGGGGAAAGFALGGPFGGVLGYGIGSGIGEFIGGAASGDITVESPVSGNIASPNLEDIYGG